MCILPIVVERSDFCSILHESCLKRKYGRRRTMAASSSSSFAKAHEAPRPKPNHHVASWMQAKVQAELYGMVEELLELGRRLSVQTIRDFVAAVHKRIPSLFLEPFACISVLTQTGRGLVLHRRASKARVSGSSRTHHWGCQCQSKLQEMATEAAMDERPAETCVDTRSACRHRYACMHMLNMLWV